MNRTPKITAILMSAALVTAFALPAFATNVMSIRVEPDVNVYVDDVPLDAGDTHGNPDCFIYNGTTYVAAAAVSKSLGQNVTWDGSTRSVHITPPAASTGSTQKNSGISYVPTTQFMVGDDILTADKIKPTTNWAVNGSTFTHTAGSAEPLRIAMGDLAVAGDEWLISFESTDLRGDVVFVSFGSEALTQTYYNGATSIAVALNVKENGDDLLITPVKSFSGKLSNFQIRKISEDGTTPYEFDSKSIVTNDDQIVKTGFWNVILGSGRTMPNAVNSTRTIAIGHNALNSIVTGNRNIGIGTYALQQLHNGEDNLAIGADSMGWIDSATRCTAVGVKSMVGYTDKIVDSTAVGTGAGFNGDQVTAIGSNAGLRNEGDDNTFIGCRAGAYVTTGSRNILIGSYTEGQPTGDFNVVIGRNANYPNGANNCVAIGKNAKATKSNQVVIGNEEITEIILGDKKLNFNPDGTVTWTEA